MQAHRDPALRGHLSDPYVCAFNPPLRSLRTRATLSEVEGERAREKSGLII
jgi:hypothetical protein